MTITSIIQIILALGLLFFGRRLYWAFVGAIGFISVTEWAIANLQGSPEWVVILMGLAVGVIGALLAIFIRAAGIGLAGFLGGAYIFMTLSNLLEITNPTLDIGLILVGGIIGLILILVLFDWALIIISALSGAALLITYIPVKGVSDWVSIAVLTIIGVIVQAREKAT